MLEACGDAPKSETRNRRLFNGLVADLPGKAEAKRERRNQAFYEQMARCGRI